MVRTKRSKLNRATAYGDPFRISEAKAELANAERQLAELKAELEGDLKWVHQVPNSLAETT